MFREEMRVLGLPGAEDVTDGSVDYYDMDWENVENGVTEEQMAKSVSYTHLIWKGVPAAGVPSAAAAAPATQRARTASRLSRIMAP